ncbi:MAG: hypothetical protein K2I87_07220 [Bacteroidales bacterium]|nr:hypothetical protein [Bacteroidales bacterium]
MDSLWVKILVPTVTAFLGAFSQWLFNRHRTRREDSTLDKRNDAQSITNIDAAVKTWKNVVNALEEQVSKLLEQRQEDSRQIMALSEEVCNLRKQVYDLQSRLASQAQYQQKIERYERLLAEHGIAY